MVDEWHLAGIGAAVLIVALCFYAMRCRSQWQVEFAKRLVADERALRSQQLESEVERLRFECSQAQEQLACAKVEAEQQRLHWIEKEGYWTALQQQMSDTFKSLSSDLLHAQSGQFLELAAGRLERFQESAKQELLHRQQAIDHLVQPLKTSLERFEQKIGEFEQARSQAHGAVKEQIYLLAQAQGQLQQEASKLSMALRIPNVKGRWGEMQLRRVVEMAGMVEHCDFVTQESIGENKRWRPDLIVNLPNGRQVIIDAKTPLTAYLDAMECHQEEERNKKLKEHAKHVRLHLNQLSSKSYWEQLQASPEFVVLFLPAEPFFQAAVEQDPSLLESGIEQRVLLATPMTLVALLKAVAVGWQQERLTRHAEKMTEWGRQLHERLCLFATYFNELRKGLDGAVKSYNQAVSSLETRLLVSARKLRDQGLTFKDELPTVEELTAFPRTPERFNEEAMQLQEALSKPNDSSALP